MGNHKMYPPKRCNQHKLLNATYTHKRMCVSIIKDKSCASFLYLFEKVLDVTFFVLYTNTNVWTFCGWIQMLSWKTCLFSVLKGKKLQIRLASYAGNVEHVQLGVGKMDGSAPIGILVSVMNELSSSLTA